MYLELFDHQAIMEMVIKQKNYLKNYFQNKHIVQFLLKIHHTWQLGGAFFPNNFPVIFEYHCNIKPL